MRLFQIKTLTDTMTDSPNQQSQLPSRSSERPVIQKHIKRTALPHSPLRPPCPSRPDAKCQELKRRHERSVAILKQQADAEARKVRSDSGELPKIVSLGSLRNCSRLVLKEVAGRISPERGGQYLGTKDSCQHYQVAALALRELQPI